MIMLYIYLVSYTLLLGSFDRCEICYNAEALLKNNPKLSKDERDVIKVRTDICAKLNYFCCDVMVTISLLV